MTELSTNTGQQSEAPGESVTFSVSIGPPIVTPTERNDVPGEAAPQQQPVFNGWIESYLTSPTGRKIRLVIKAVTILIILAIFVVQQIQFKDTWSRACDYELKIWSTVWMCRSLLQHTTIFTVSTLLVFNRCRYFMLVMRRFQTLIFLFKLCWFFYGIKPVLVEPQCDPTSKTWGKTAWL